MTDIGITYGKWLRGEEWNDRNYHELPMPYHTIVLLVSSDIRKPDAPERAVATKWIGWAVEDNDGYVYDMMFAGFEHIIKLQKIGERDEYARVTMFAILPSA
jgi:hypothetical protein